jgi:hypothetical protein
VEIILGGFARVCTKKLQCQFFLVHFTILLLLINIKICEVKIIKFKAFNEVSKKIERQINLFVKWALVRPEGKN